MKKSLIALAIASAVSAPAFAATSNVDVYGRMSFSVDYANTNDPIGDNDDIVAGRDNVSRVGLKGTEDLGGGLAAVWQVEAALNTGESSAVALRNTFIGVKSEAGGTVVMGRHDTPYKLATSALDIFSDTAGDYNTIIGTTADGTIFDNRAAQTIAYMSPNWTGFTFALAYAAPKSVETANSNNGEGYSAMAQYANGPFFASLAYETFSGDFGPSTPIYDVEAMKVGLGFRMDAFKLGAIYEDISDDESGSASSRDAYYINGMFTMGAWDLKAAYGISNDGESAVDTEFDTYSIGADYNLSKRTKLFGVYSAVNNGSGSEATLSTTGYDAVMGNDVEVFSLGVTHSF